MLLFEYNNNNCGGVTFDHIKPNLGPSRPRQTHGRPTMGNPMDVHGRVLGAIPPPMGGL
jgi:hypothetical protein